MIELYAKGTTDFSKHGIALAASQASVTYQDNGRFDMDMTMPYNAAINIDYGMIVRCPVPAQEIPAITLGTVSYWEVASGQSDVPLYKSVPVVTTIKYSEWCYAQEYMAGSKVSYNKKNYQASHNIVDIDTTMSPDNYPNGWSEIARTTITGGEIITNLDAGDMIIKTGDFSDRYMKAADVAGHEGFIEISTCTDLSETDTRTVPAQSIREQSFTISEITKSSDGKLLTIHAEHISYQLGRTLLGDCNISRATPATALMLIRGAMKGSYPGELETNLTGDDALITGDFSWKNAQAAILDPKAGFLNESGGHIIRNDLNVYIIREGEANAKYRITYGTNLKAVKWDGDVSDLVTRIYPIAQREDGSTLLLPEEYIDTVRTIPYIRPEALKTGLKIGQKEQQEDGSEIELDEDTVYARMREAAYNRFNIDECDKATITLEVDWQHLPDTDEYKAYAALMNAAPGEWVLVKNSPLGIDTTIQLTGYAFDPILRRYTKGTFGKKKVSSGVASYDIQSGAVTSRALGAGAVGSQNLQAECITAREIEANSITAEKIASRSITTELLMAGAITADEIAANAITTEKLAAGSVTANKIAAHSITSDQIMAGTITAALIAAGAITSEVIAAGAITTEKLAAGSVEASKIAALAITTEKLAAGAITADKIGAGAITAAKISTDDLAAIQATLQIASIANAQIASADIGYAQVKDLTAGSAYFGQAIIQAGVANKLFIPRLMVDYAQMVSATIGDLVIQASDDNYYKLDVDMDGKVTATQITPSAAEIAAGHTDDGRTIYTASSITAGELNTTDIYASHALIDAITATQIDVDELWARQAFINKLMVQDISSNTYIQSTIGNWQSQSTITQTIAGINSRITQLGYGTIFYSETEPSPSGVVTGDIWVQPIDDQTWNDVSQYTWEELASFTWEQVAGQYRMYVWTGTQWKLLFDNLVISELQTEIAQTAYAVTLKADATVVNALSDDVTAFGARLDVQAEQISAAVSSVNQKTSGYVQLTDPSLDSGVSLSSGDTWTKAAGNGTWDSLADYTWDELAALTWDELAGAVVYTWNGTAWIQTADAGMTIQNRALIEESDKRITLLVEEQTIIVDQVYRNTASITIQADRITQEVERATNAENGKIAKTTQYQTADEIVSEAVSQSASSADGLFLKKTTSYQTADAIVNAAVAQAATAAGQAYIAKTSTYQTAESIKTEAVRASGISAAQLYLEKTSTYSTVDSIINKANALADAAANTAKSASIAKTATYQSADSIVSAAVAQAATAAGQTYIAKTVSYQTADAIVNAAESYTDNQLTSYSTTTQTANLIAAAVGDCYGKVSGIGITPAGVDISGSQYVAIASGGCFKVITGDFGIDTSQNGVCMWAGASSSDSANFKVKKNGEVTLTKLLALDESGTETEVNLRIAGLWKLNYHTVKSVTSSGGYCTGMTLSNGTTVNFKSAATVYTVAARVASAPADYTATWTVETDLSNGASMTVALADTYGPLKALYNSGWNDAVDHMLVLGTVYRITAHMNDWVKVEAVGTGYTNPGYIN